MQSNPDHHTESIAESADAIGSTATTASTISSESSVSVTMNEVAASSSKSSRKTKTATVQGWGYDWLEYTECTSQAGVVQKMWCRLCRKYKDKVTSTVSSNPGQSQLCDLDAFVVGTCNIKKDTAKCHSQSKIHLEARKAEKESTTGRKSTVAEQLQEMGQTVMTKMVKLFDIAYTIGKSELPFTLYPTLISMEKRAGVDLGVTYQNDKSCREFIGHIAGNMREKTTALFHDRVDEDSQELQEPFYCSVLFDGSTDKSTEEKEMISIKVIEDGRPKIKFLG